MTTEKKLGRLKAFIGAQRRAQIKQAAAIKEVLRELKKKERDLIDKLEKCGNDKERDKLIVKIAVCHSQRKKGLAILKDIKAGK